MRVMLVFLVFLTANCWAGPFGVVPGLSAEDQGMSLTEHRPFTYVAENIPSPHSLFETYIVIQTPKHGVCKMMAFTKGFENDGYGSTVRSKYSELRDALANKYGDFKEYDHLKSGSIWDKSQYYAMSLYKNDRDLVSFWTLKKPVDHALNITVKASAHTSSKTYVSLAYEFEKTNECLDWIAAQDNQNL